MTKEQLQELKDWFGNYTKSFYSTDEGDQRNIMLKVEHTHHVCMNIVEIAGGASLDDNQTRAAEAIALFHDLGRFPQYAEFKTFRDAVSVNHGLLGRETLIKEKVLHNLPEDEQERIAMAVNFHNAFSIPTTMDGDVVLFLKLIRDADKADIYRVFIEYFETPKHERASATAFGVPDSPECSQVMLDCIAGGQVASYSNIKTENDFKLMLLSWVYDLHFQKSVSLVAERDYINRIINKLPQTDEVLSPLRHLKEFIDRRLHNDQRQ